ncbi:MAG: tetratricopeptide repeat protein [Bacteroidota bacterium]
MKRLMMLMLAVVIGASALAQNKNVNKANIAREKGELAEAIALIEPATTFEKTMNKGRTWYIRGQIYGDIATSEDETIRAIDPKASVKAAESYRKVLELEKEGSTYHGLSNINLTNLNGSIMNKGVDAFNSEDYETALAAFSEYSEVSPKDTTGYLYSALMAQQLERYDEVVKWYDKVFAIDYYPKSGFNSVIYYEMNKLDDYESALKHVKLAQEKFPEDNNFKKTEVDILIKMDKLDDAINELKAAIAAEPENAGLYTNLGLLYDSQEEYELAIEQYKKALAIDPNDRFSLINMAVYHIGRGDKVYKKALELDVRAVKEFDKIEAEAKSEWSKSIPLLDKVLEADDTDELALQNLHAVYYKLKDFKMAKKYEDRRKELGYIIDEE